MKELEYRAIKALIYIYEFSLTSPASDHFVKDAERIYLEYLPASTLLHEEINKAVNNLFPFAYPGQSQKFTKLTQAEIKDLLLELRNILKQEFEVE